MCAKFFYVVLAAFLTFNIVTIVAFIYLPWWQALLVVLGVIVMLTLAGKYLIRSAVRSAFQVSSEVMAQHARVLRNAQVVVHRVSPVEMPPEVSELFENDEDDEAPSAEELRRAENLLWREIELTIFPELSQLKPGDSASWNPYTVCLVPESWTYEDDFVLEDDAEDDGSIAIYGMRVIDPEGNAVEPNNNELQGVQRLRFVAGIPRSLTSVSLAYLTEKFGEIRLPPALPPTRPQ